MPIPKTVEQTVEIIADRIRSRDTGYEPGARLPTYPELAKTIPTSTATLGRAMRKLREMGLVVGVRGEGTWIAEGGADE